MRARLVAKEMGVGLSRNLSLNVAVVITVALTLALVGVGLLINEQINVMKGYWYDKVNVSIYLCGKTSLEPSCHGHGVTEQERQQIRADLQAMPEVKTIYYESSAQAYQNYKKLFKNSPDLVKNVDPSALPESFRVKLNDPTKFAVVADRFATEPGVQLVQDQRAILNKLFRALHGFQVGAYAVAGTLVAVAILLIFNAIRVAAFSRRRETGIMRLVGASRAYVWLPFVLEGAFVGLVGAVLGAGMLALFKWAFIDKGLRPNIPSINFIGWDWVYDVIPVLVGSSVVLAALASFVTVRRYLRV